MHISKKSIRNQFTDKWMLFAMFSLLIGIVVRMLSFGHIPYGMNQDEAYAGYEAYSLMHYGIDSHGYAFPVYLTVWGSGMSVLQTYLMIPCIAIFGFKDAAVRLPQLMMSLVTLVVFYQLLRKVTDQKMAAFGLFLLAVNPWHIMIARWALDCNLAPAFLLLGLYFWVLGMENDRFLFLSALFFGISLYAYAVIWMTVPILLLFLFLYGWYFKKIRFTKNVVGAVALLTVIALPLLLFVLVNKGLLTEIKTPYFSIPKLAGMRDSEISLQGIGSNAKSFAKLLITQRDGNIWSAIPGYGIYYMFSLPFIGMGALFLVKDFIFSLKNKSYDAVNFVFLSGVAAFITALLVSDGNVNKVNGIHIPAIFCCGYAIYRLSCIAWKHFLTVAVAAYLVSFAAFSHTYYTDYAKMAEVGFFSGFQECLAYAKQVTNGTICADAYQSLVLYYDKTPVREFINTVEYTNYPNPWLDVNRFGRYELWMDSADIRDDVVYICGTGKESLFTNRGFQIKKFHSYLVAYK